MLSEFPIIVFDTEYHKALIAHIDLMKSKGTISVEDLSLCLFTDSVEDAIDHLKKNAIEKFELKYKKAGKPKWWLFEKNKF